MTDSEASGASASDSAAAGDADQRPRADDHELRAGRVLAETAGIIGAWSYASGWLFFAALYFGLGVYPEEAGLDFSFLVVRVGLIASAVVLAFSALTALSDSPVAVEHAGGISVSTRAFNAAVAALLTLVIATSTIVIVTLEPWEGGGAFRSSARTAGAVLAGVVVVGLILAALFSGAHMPGGAGSVRPRFTQAGVLIVVGLATIGVAVIAGTLAGRAVVDGDTMFAPILGVDAVRPANGAALGGRSSCLVYLGASDGVAVLLSPADDAVLRVSTELLELESIEGPCK